MNYDFKTNWEEKIKPILKTPALQKALKQSIKKYLKTDHSSYIDKYDKTKLPLEYARVDSFCILYNEIKDKVIEDLLKWEIIKENPIPLSADDDDCDTRMDWEESIQHITEPYIRDRMEKNYQAYCLYGACFWYNTNFGLKLAQTIMPSVKWIVKRSNIHATVVSTDEKLVFDILYYNEDEANFGGRNAINDTNNKISWEEHHKVQHDLHNKKMSKKKRMELETIKDRKYNPKYIELS